MTTVDYDHIFDCLFIATKQAGAVAKTMQPTITNIGKDMVSMSNDSDHITSLRNAKSIADDVVQEILLNALCEDVDFFKAFSLDAEEITQSVNLIAPMSNSNNTLVIDPIDGTYAYCMHKDNYSICSAIVLKGVILFAIVFFPARDIMYYFPPYSHSKILIDASRNDKSKSTVIEYGLKNPTPKIVYKNSRVPENIVRNLEERGFKVIDDTVNMMSCPSAIIECIEGHAHSYICHTRNLRDILMGAITAKTIRGKALNWSGETLLWPQGGRVSDAIFSRYDVTDEYISCLCI